MASEAFLPFGALKIKSRHQQYRNYLSDLTGYLLSFFERTQPLQDVDKVLAKVEADFEDRWKAGNIQGWEDRGVGSEKSDGISIDIDDYESIDELVELGPERLKQALAALGLKTGGTVQQRAERLFITKYTPLEKIDRKHFSKALTPEDLQAAKEVALAEAKIQRLCELVQDAIEETKGHVEKKQSYTYEEMEAEREEEEVQAESDSDEEEQQIYNPLKLPMGWDGKPIPYWLYKLHGLGQEFKCEICGNYSYWGRRAFERHFKEWRHQHGMRCLGIPNTKNFHEITIIKDAKELWEKIQERQGVNKWRPDLEEEYEDQEGNVYNKKTYTDLQRQGLI
ncbi:hypothetical protein KP509_22G050500 [Ceratopteris richardii]|uniref:Matrin-type domain-containing protein n=1 Tax=Ceratopteris richardii TaxID=49495 RepID=A0A8T2S4Y8_CERRI|nr:hypothetical protein KP509_22G050500 [Ceratopteris richardii]